MIQTDMPFVGVPAGPGGTAFGSDYASGSLEWDLDLFTPHPSVDPRAMSLDYSADIDHALQALHAANAAPAEPTADDGDFHEGGYLYATPGDSFNPRFRADSVSSAHSLDMLGDYLYDSTPQYATPQYSEDSMSPDAPPSFDLMSALSALSGDVEYPFQGSPQPFASSPFMTTGTVSPTAITKQQFGELDDLVSYSSLNFQQQPFGFMDPPTAPRGLRRDMFPVRPDPVPALSVDNTLSRLKLEYPAPKASADVQSFIRCVVCRWCDLR